MFVKQIMYTCVCDNCKIDLLKNADYSCMDIDGIGYELEESNWKIAGKKHYCDYCYSYDDDDKMVINKERFKPISNG